MNIPDRLELQVVTPDRLVLSDVVDEVNYRTTEGYVGILPGHIPMLTTLQTGELTYRARGKQLAMVVSSGFVEVLPHRVIVMAEHVDLPDEIDRNEALKEKADAEARMKIHTEESEFIVEQERIEEAVAKLAVASRHLS